MWLLHFLPLPLLAQVGNALGMLLYWSAAERRHVAATNLRLCFPELSEAERKALARKNSRPSRAASWSVASCGGARRRASRGTSAQRGWSTTPRRRHAAR